MKEFDDANVRMVGCELDAIQAIATKYGLTAIMGEGGYNDNEFYSKIFLIR